MRPSQGSAHVQGRAGHSHLAASPDRIAASDSTPLLAEEDTKEDHHHHVHLQPSSHSLSAKQLNGASSRSSLSSDFGQFLDRYFCISARSSTIATEVRGGVVTFATMAYILAVNSEILSNARTPALPGMDYDGVVLATAVSAAVGSGLVGVWGNLPFGLAAGMGLNSYFTYAVVIQLNQPFQVALTASFVHGVLFLLLSLMGTCNLMSAALLRASAPARRPVSLCSSSHSLPTLSPC